MEPIPYEISRWKFDNLMRNASNGVQYDIPAKLPRWVKIEIIYPFAGAAARAIFRDRAHPENYVSSYLDVASALGSMPGPYFEIYPAANGDAERFFPRSQEKMYAAILKSLRKQARDAAKRSNAEAV